MKRSIYYIYCIHIIRFPLFGVNRRTHAHTHMHAHTHTRTRAHTHKHAYTYTQTQTHKPRTTKGVGKNNNDNNRACNDGNGKRAERISVDRGQTLYYYSPRHLPPSSPPPPPSPPTPPRPRSRFLANASCATLRKTGWKRIDQRQRNRRE